MTVECDEKADCTGGQLCCQNNLNTQCKADCGGGAGAIQRCKTGAECKDGTCYVNMCPGAGGGMTIVEACSKIPFCTQ